MLPAKLIDRIQACVNHLLKQDEETLAVIKKSSGKVIEIQVTGPELGIYMQYCTDGFLIMQEFSGKPNVVIRATPGTYFTLMTKRDSIQSPDMEINGDVGLAQEFQQLLKDLEIDWEEELSHWTGDIAAHQLTRLFRSTRNYLRDTHQTVASNISEYLRFEKQLVADGTEINEFINQVDELRNDVERLRQRVNRLYQPDHNNHG